MTQTACILCGETGGALRKVIAGGCRIWNCAQCGFVWIDRRDLAKVQAPCYEDYPYNQRLREQFPRMKLRYLAGFVARVKASLGRSDYRNCSFLDVGCANGEYMWAAREAGFGEVSGVEVDRVSAERARYFGQVYDDLARVPTGHYDLVQVKNVLANIPDLVGFMDSCVQTLRSGGLLWLDVLNWDSLTSLLRRWSSGLQRDPRRLGVLRPPYVINAFERRTVRILLTRLGLEVLGISTAYLGHRVVPYASPSLVGYAGVAGWLIGRGPMIISDSRKH